METAAFVIDEEEYSQIPGTGCSSLGKGLIPEEEIGDGVF